MLLLLGGDGRCPTGQVRREPRGTCDQLTRVRDSQTTHVIDRIILEGHCWGLNCSVPVQGLRHSAWPGPVSLSRLATSPDARRLPARHHSPRIVSSPAWPAGRRELPGRDAPPAKSGDALCPDADRALVPVDVMTETRPHPARRPTAANSPPSAWDDTRATEVSERRATGVPRGT